MSTTDSWHDIDKLRGFVEQLAIDDGFRVLDIVTSEESTTWLLILADRPWVLGCPYWRLSLDNTLGMLLNDKNKAATTELVRNELRKARDGLKT